MTQAAGEPGAQTQNQGGAQTAPPVVTPVTPPATGAQAGAGSHGENQPEVDETKWDDKTKAYIKTLRDENGKHRKKNKDLEGSLKVSTDQMAVIKKTLGLTDETVTPEEQVKNLTQKNEDIAFERHILKSAISRGISEENLEYYQFLISKKVDGLKDNEEMTDEMLDAIAGEVNKRNGGKPITTSVGGGAGNGQPPPKAGDNTGLTPQLFAKMTVLEKSELFGKQPEIYDSLFKQAKDLKILI